MLLEGLGRFYSCMTIVKKEDYDPINDFWFPVCEEDVKGDMVQVKIMNADNVGHRWYTYGVDNITAIVNYWTPTYQERRDAYKNNVKGVIQ